MRNARRWVLVTGLVTSLGVGAAAPTGAWAQGEAAPGKDAAKPAEVPDSALWDGRKIAPFKGLDHPKMVKAGEADFLEDGDYVLGVTVQGESRAYPTRFIWFHHVVNDRIGETPYAVTYCSVCNTGIRFDPVVNGKTLTLDFYGLCNGVVALYDRETESVWPQVTGRAARGPLAGTQLKHLPVLDTTWKEWKRLHPDTLVMSPETPFRQFYRPKGMPEPRDYQRFPAPFFRPTVSRGDKRLPPFEKVLAVTVAAADAPAGTEPARRAYPVAALDKAGQVVNDTLGGQAIAVFLQPETTTANAVSRVLDGKTLTFEVRKQPDGTRAIFDRETGTRWSVEGKGEEGELAGKSLRPVENHLSQWYGWAAFFPETTIYGRTDAPQPGDPFAPREGAPDK